MYKLFYCILSVVVGFLSIETKAQELAPLFKELRIDTLSEEERVNYILENAYKIRAIDFTKSLQLQQYALSYFTTNSNKDKQAEAYKNIGVSYYLLGELDSALNNYLFAKSLFEATSNELGLANLLNELSVLYRNTDQVEKSLELLDQTEEICRRIGNLDCLGTSLDHRATIFTDKNDFESAKPYMLEVVNIREQAKDSVGLGYVYLRMSGYYRSIQKIDSAIYYNELSRNIRQAIFDVQGVAITHVELAEIYFANKAYKKAIQQYETCIKLAKEIRYRKLLFYAFNQKTEAYKKMNNWEAALTSLEEANAYSDSLLNLDKIEAITEIQTKYETEQKERELAENKLEIQTQKVTIINQRNQITMVIAGAILLGLMGLIFYNRGQVKKKREIEQAILKEKEKGFMSVIYSTEQERKRISHDLHDGIGQQMTALRLALINLGNNLSNEKKDEVEKITEISMKAAEEIRYISHQMMPKALLEKGLIEAIEDLLQSTFEYSSINYVFEHNNLNRRFDEKVEINIYRVLQELINNIIKHAGATEVSVQLLYNANKLVLFVEDNGKGMTNDKKDGKGLLNIQSRLHMVDGKVNYEPSTVSGTVATVTIPIVS